MYCGFFVMKVENSLKENVMGHFCLTFYKTWESAKIHFKIVAIIHSSQRSPTAERQYWLKK